MCNANQLQVQIEKLRGRIPNVEDMTLPIIDTEKDWANEKDIHEVA